MSRLSNIALTCIVLVGLVFCGSQIEAKVSMLSKMTYEKEVESGEVYTETIKVFNTSNHVEEVLIKQFDYLFDCSGKTDFAKVGSHTRSNAKWIVVESEPIKVPPQSSKDIPVQIKVPKSRQLNGCYWSVIMVEPFERAKQSNQNQTVQLKTLVRYAVQVICNIKGTGDYQFNVKNKKLVINSGVKVLQFDVYNTGSLAIAPKNWIEILSDKGESMGVFEGKKMRVYPQTSARFFISLEGLEKGSYNGLIIFDQASADYFGVRYDFTIDSSGKQAEDSSKVAVDKNSDLYGLAEFTPWYRLSSVDEMIEEITYSVLPVALFELCFQSTEQSYLAWAPYTTERKLLEKKDELNHLEFISKGFVQKAHLWFLEKSPVYQYRALLSKIIPESLIEGLDLLSKFDNISCLSKCK